MNGFTNLCHNNGFQFKLKGKSVLATQINESVHSESPLSGIKYQVSGIRDQVSGIMDQGSGIIDYGSGIREQVTGNREQETVN